MQKESPETKPSSLRDHLVTNDVSYKVAKKTLISKAAVRAQALPVNCPKLELLRLLWQLQELKPIAPARSVHDFQKNTEGDLKIVGGVFENKFMD